MDPALRGYFRLPGTGTLIKLGGFVKTDIFIDANQAGSYYGAYVPSSFPSSPQPHSVNATVSMRPSRFYAEFRQPVHDGTESVKGYLEYDFLGNYERTSLRLRQFYAQYKNVLAGQAWTSFGDADAFPDTSIVLNHMCHAMALEMNEQQRAMVFQQWRNSLIDLARRPNVSCKIGGLGLPRTVAWPFTTVAAT